jgi:transcriptional regulator with XRE-family HTH domain
MSAADLDAIDLQIGRNIRFYRLWRQLSQAKLAARVGMSYQQLQKYERGINRIPASRLHVVAQALSVPIGAMFEPAAMPKGDTASGYHSA